MKHVAFNHLAYSMIAIPKPDRPPCANITRADVNFRIEYGILR